MFDWLGSWFSRGWAGLGDLAGAVRQAIANALGQLVSRFLTWQNAMVYTALSAAHAWQALIRFLIALSGFAGRLVFVRLPAIAVKVLADAAAFTERRIGDVVNFVQASVDNALNLTRQLYGDLRSWATAQLRSIIDTLSNVWTLLQTVAHRVFDLLTDPRALADWIAGHIVQAVYRWALGNAELLARWAFNGAVTGALRFADIAERIIADIFL